MPKRLWQLASCVVVAAASVAGCAKARAATVPNGPPLSMPEPPPRVFAPADEPPLAATPVAAEAAPVEAPVVQPQRPPRRTVAAAAEPEKPEPTPAPAQPAPEPPRELRAASTPADAEAQRKIKTVLTMATRDLNLVDVRKLSEAGREQWQQARSFSEQAEEALTQRNYVFADTLADKAAKLAAELRGVTSR
jgi:hypothetical protein